MAPDESQPPSYPARLASLDAIAWPRRLRSRCNLHRSAWIVSAASARSAAMRRHIASSVSSPVNVSRRRVTMSVIWWEPHLDGGRWQSAADVPIRPTHWMPLPEAPR